MLELPCSAIASQANGSHCLAGACRPAQSVPHGLALCLAGLCMALKVSCEAWAAQR